MHPILVKVGPITIYTYGFMFALGVLSAIILSLHLAKKTSIDTKKFSDLVFFTIISGLIGAKLLLFITNIKEYLTHPGEIKYLLTSGGTFYGGLIFGALFAFWYMKNKKMDILLVADAIAPTLALAHFFGRLGCFFAGCCWGRHAGDSPLGIIFSNPDVRTGVQLNTPLYPTQLMESLLNLMNFAFLLWFYFREQRYKGQIFLLYIFNYSIIRFVIEYFRGDLDRGYVIGGIQHPFTSLSVPQLISLTGITISVILHIILSSKKKKSQPDNNG